MKARRLPVLFAATALNALGCGMPARAEPYNPNYSQLTPAPDTKVELAFKTEHGAVLRFLADGDPDETGDSLYFCPGANVSRLRQCFQLYTMGGRVKTAQGRTAEMMLSFYETQTALSYINGLPELSGLRLSCPERDTVTLPRLPDAFADVMSARIMAGDVKLNLLPDITNFSAGYRLPDGSLALVAHYHLQSHNRAPSNSVRAYHSANGVVKEVAILNWNRGEPYYDIERVGRVAHGFAGPGPAQGLAPVASDALEALVAEGKFEPVLRHQPLVTPCSPPQL